MLNSLLFITVAGLELKDILIGLGVIGGVLLLIKGMNTPPDMKNGNGGNGKNNNTNNNRNTVNSNNNNNNNSTGQ